MNGWMDGPSKKSIAFEVTLETGGVGEETLWLATSMAEVQLTHLDSK